MDQTELLRTLINAFEPLWYLGAGLAILCTLLLLPWYRKKNMRALPWGIISVLVVSTAILHFTFWS